MIAFAIWRVPVCPVPSPCRLSRSHFCRRHIGAELIGVPVLAGSAASALAEAVGWQEGPELEASDARGCDAVPCHGGKSFQSSGLLISVNSRAPPAGRILRDFCPACISQRCPIVGHIDYKDAKHAIRHGRARSLGGRGSGCEGLPQRGDDLRSRPKSLPASPHIERLGSAIYLFQGWFATDNGFPDCGRSMRFVRDWPRGRRAGRRADGSQGHAVGPLGPRHGHQHSAQALRGPSKPFTE